MALLVQKFGGTSVADPDRIRAVADHIVRSRRAGDDVVVVVSAMGKSTDDLVRLAHDVARQPGGREMDMLLTAGERISMALLTMAVEDLGQPAVSFTGSQAGIVTDTEHGKAKIIEVRADRIREALDRGSRRDRRRLPGRVDRRATSPRSVAAAPTPPRSRSRPRSRADVCEIYTDVEGVYTADPRVVPTARKLPHVLFDEMLEMAATGGRVLALRSVEFARNHHVKVHVRSSFTWAPGTWITEEASMDATESMEQAIISGVTHDTSEAKVTIEQVPDRPGVAATIFRDLADAGVNVDMIVQNVSTAGHTDISFTVPRSDAARASQCMEKIVVDTEASGFRTDERIGRVSLVGAGMKTHPGVAAKMFEVLATEGINIEMISTSTIRISCVVAEDDVERAVQSLHAAFELAGD